MQSNNFHRFLLLIICPFLINISVYSTRIIHKSTIKGEVIDSQTNEPIPFASIYIHEISLGIASDNNGNYFFSTSYEGTVKITASYIGYQPLDTIIKLPDTKNLLLKLQPSSYALNEIVVSAKEGTKGNSVSLIEKDAMQHIQPSSFADLLQLLPGHSSKEINMSTPEYITMRQAGTDINTALGTSFIVNGTTLDNDANLQNLYGFATSSGQGAGERLTTSRGIDMRTIPTDQIESVEIVRGIPSAKYGDLTAGLVKIELKNGHTPWEGRVKTDFKNKLFSVGKGIVLANNRGILNVDMDHAIYNTEPRISLTNYTRTTFSARYENNLKLNKDIDLRYKFDAGYTGSFDKIKTDPDALSKDDYLKNSYSNYKLSARGTLKLKKTIFKEINYNIAYSQTKDKLDEVKMIATGGTRPLTTASMVEGEYETGYLPAEYLSKLIIDGNPVTLSAKVDARSELKVGKSVHSILYGSDFTFNKNSGKGEQYDVQLPPSTPTQSSRPVTFSDIPALQKLSFFLEDNANMKLGHTKLWLQAGIRATTMPGINSKYTMSGKYYWEPRINTKYTLPQFNIAGQRSTFAITAGAGQFYKSPTLAQLYPHKRYFDYIQLNYFSTSNPDYRFANIRTYIEDFTNYALQPAKNIKYEVGLIFTLGNIKLDATFFKEKMKNGFSSGASYLFHNYKDYEAGSVQNPTSKPSINDFTYTDMTIGSTYSQASNDAQIEKTGIEYTLDLGTIKPIYTRIWINGAWFKTNYAYGNEYFYRKPTNLINGKPYPYIGVYTYGIGEKSKNTKEQFNTNINFDTHIPLLRMVFSTTIETMWFGAKQTAYNTGSPIAYIDLNSQWHEYTPDMADDGTMKHLLDLHNAYSFSRDKEAVAARVNLKLSKEIGDNIRMSCFFNNILTYLPDYTSVYGTTASRSLSPWFGAELNIKFHKCPNN